MTKPISDANTLRARALALLARREHSAKELHRKLLPHVQEGDDLEALLQDFIKRGWVSDERFAELVVNARQKRYGSLKLAHELREKGVADEVIVQATEVIDDFENARIIWQKKFGKASANREEWARQARFLQSRGFGFDIIKRVLNAINEDIE
jgi:regulatory protein